MTPQLHFIDRRGNVFTLGTVCPLTLRDLRWYVRRFPIHWVSA